MNLWEHLFAKPSGNKGGREPLYASQSSFALLLNNERTRPTPPATTDYRGRIVKKIEFGIADNLC